MFIEWLRKKLNLPACKNCEVLMRQLEISNEEKRKLLNSILEFSKPIQPIISDKEEEKPVKPANLTTAKNWRVQAALLEEEDRQKAQLMARKQQEELDKLEKEIFENDAI